MRILVTGGTGYVGSHAVAALVRAGHEIRLLVRDPARIEPALAPLGVGTVEHLRGDITDRGAVAEAIAGCDGILHAAAQYTFDSRQASSMRRINLPGTELVLSEAVRQGLDPIVYVSSVAAFFPGSGAVADADSPVGESTAPYMRTKAEAERVARGLQERGEGLTIVYPGVVLGPDDPHLGEQMQLVRNILQRRLPVVPRGGMHVVDVRDVADTIAATFAGRGTSRRYIVPGHQTTVAGIVRGLAEVTGKRLPALALPAAALLLPARGADRLQRIVPVRLPVSSEAILSCQADLRFDDAPAREELGIDPRPFERTLADTVRWLIARGQIRPRQAGALRYEQAR